MDQDLLGKNSQSQSEKKETKKGKREDRPNEGFGMNLIVEERKKEVSQDILRKNLIQIFGSALIAGVIVGVVYLGIRWYGSTKEHEIQLIKDAIQKVDAQISTLEANYTILVNFQTKLSSTKDLLENHTSFVKFFNELEKVTLSNVSYQTVAFSDEGTVTLSATSTDYASAGRQLLAFQQAQPFIKSVKMSAVNGMLSQTGDLAGVSFSVNLTLDKKWLKKKDVMPQNQVIPPQSPNK